MIKEVEDILDTTLEKIQSEFKKNGIIVDRGGIVHSLRTNRYRFFIDIISEPGYFELAYYRKYKKVKVIINSMNLDNRVIYESLLSKLNTDKLINKLMLFVVNYENEYDNDYI